MADGIVAVVIPEVEAVQIVPKRLQSVVINHSSGSIAHRACIPAAVGTQSILPQPIQIRSPISSLNWRIRSIPPPSIRVIIVEVPTILEAVPV